MTRTVLHLAWAAALLLGCSEKRERLIDRLDGSVSSIGSDAWIGETSDGTSETGGATGAGGASETSAMGGMSDTGGEETAGQAGNPGQTGGAGGVRAPEAGAAGSTGAGAYLVVCGAGPEIPPAAPQGAGAAGHVPTRLTQHMGLGVAEDKGGTWLASSGVDWDYRWTYFAPGQQPGSDWYNTWGTGSADGSFATAYLEECDAQGFVPVVQYYNIAADYVPTGESHMLAKLQNAADMKDYFSKFKVLLQKAKAFGKTVVVIIEGNGVGLLQQQSNGDPTKSAAIASAGLSELSALPNTVAGFGLAFLQLRSAVGADNVVMGIDVPYWGTGDLISYQFTDDIQAHVDTQYAFLSSFGIAPNQTGATFDFLASNPSDCDFDWYRLARGSESEDVWWDPSDTASAQTRSFNRYAEWLRRFNQASKQRWILWMVPMGNSNSPNIDNPHSKDGSLPKSAAGWKDNRAEYFFCSQSNRHLGLFAEAGVIALLFGTGHPGCTDETSDYSPEGQLFLKSHADALARSGGFPLVP